MKWLIGIAILCFGIMVLALAAYQINGEAGSSLRAGAPALFVALVILAVGSSVIVSAVRDRHR